MYRRKKSTLEIRYDRGEKLSDDEIEQLIREIYDLLTHHPLRSLHHGGYCRYDNDKDWKCHFCEKEIKAKSGYWGLNDMHWSVGSKLCHECFLKFITMMEENEYLMLLFEKIRGKELRILDIAAHDI